MVTPSINLTGFQICYHQNDLFLKLSNQVAVTVLSTYEAFLVGIN